MFHSSHKTEAIVFKVTPFENQKVKGFWLPMPDELVSQRIKHNHLIFWR